MRIGPFEEFAERYEAWFEKHRATYLSELAALAMATRGFEVGLEVGVGTGRFAAPLGVRFGVDPSPRMFKLTRSRGIRVVRAVAEDLPFRDGLFDLVPMVTTICFLDGVEAAFREVKRVLRPDGRFVLGFIDRESPVRRRIASMRQNPFYAEGYTP